MAIDSEGFNGEFTETAAAHLSHIYKQPCVIDGALAYSGPVAGEDRTLRFTGGVFYGHSIRAEADSDSDIAFDSVLSGTRYDTVVARFDFSTNTTSLIKVNGGSSATVAAGLLNNPGVTVDWPIYLVRFNAGATTPASVVDLREFHGYDGVRRFATTTGRDYHAADATFGTRVMVDNAGAYEYGVNGAGLFGWQLASDSGWVPLPYATGITALSGTPAVRREGSRVTLRGRVRRTNGADIGSTTPLGTLPAGFRPVAPGYNGPCGTTPNGSGSAALITIDAAGAIVPYLHVTVQWVSLDGVSYYVD